jgi:hypothetical protein
MTLQLIDQRGNKADYQVDSVPRIGDRVVLSRDNLAANCYRVIDVVYHLNAPSSEQVSLLVEEDDDPGVWPAPE